MRPLSALMRKCLIVTAIFILVMPAIADARMFTVLDPVSGVSGVPFNITGTEPGNPGVVGTINPVFSIAGGAGFVWTDTAGGGGNPAFGIGPTLPDFFIFDITLAAGSASIDQLSLTLISNTGLPLGEPTDAGYFIEAGQSPIGVTVSPLIQLFPFPIGTGSSTFDFGLGTTNPANNLDAGETSVRMFVLFSSPFSLLEMDTVSFMISAGTNFTVQAEIIPEPGTLFLLGSGLAGLGFLGRGRRRRSGS